MDRLIEPREHGEWNQTLFTGWLKEAPAGTLLMSNSPGTYLFWKDDRQVWTRVPDKTTFDNSALGKLLSLNVARTRTRRWVMM